jgi:hypothetical protein
MKRTSRRADPGSGLVGQAETLLLMCSSLGDTQCPHPVTLHRPPSSSNRVTVQRGRVYVRVDLCIGRSTRQSHSHQGGVITEHCGSMSEADRTSRFQAECCRSNRRRISFRSQMLSFMQTHDVILCPVNAYPAMLHGAAVEKVLYFSYTFTYNLTGWPGVVVRVGTTATGLPIGVQVVARPWRKDVALKVAHFLEKMFGGWIRPPV